MIADAFFTDPDRFTVTVYDGIVTLEGAPGSAVLGASIVGQAEQPEGVVAVRDRFTYPGSDRSSLRPGTLVPGDTAGTPLPPHMAHDHDGSGRTTCPGPPGTPGSAKED